MMDSSGMSDHVLLEILERLKNLETKLDLIGERLGIIEKSARVMDDHVNWVNGVHNAIKTPLYTALNAVNSIMHPISGRMVDIEEIPDAPHCSRPRLTHVEQMEM